MRRREKGEGFPGQKIVVLPRPVVAASRQQPLLKNLFPTDIGFFPKATGHLRERKAGIDQAIFIFCADGAGWCEMKGRRHEVRRGELLVIPPFTPHVYGTQKHQSWTIHWFHAVGENLPLYLAELGVPETAVLHCGDATPVLAIFDDILDAIETGYAPLNLLYASHALSHLMAIIIRQQRERWKGQPDSRQKVSHSIAFMKQHLAKPLDVPTLATRANLSVSHFAALFKQETNYSPMEFLIRLRMHRACQLLDTTDLGVKQIAGQLGYEDPLYFSRVFRSVNEVPPSEYRALHKG